MIREDYVLRLIRQAAQLLARVLKLKDEQQVQQAQVTLEQAFEALLGPERKWLREVDTGTVALLLDDPEVMRMLARLTVTEAELLEAQGKLLLAWHKERWALELLLEAQVRSVKPSAELREEIQQLEGRLSARQVASAYGEVVERLKEEQG